MYRQRKLHADPHVVAIVEHRLPPQSPGGTRKTRKTRRVPIFRGFYRLHGKNYAGRLGAKDLARQAKARAANNGAAV